MNQEPQFLVEMELVVLAVIYFGAALAFIRAYLLRREAVRAWRAAVGGNFDRGAHRFANELELDRARLPPEARAKLLESRRVLLAGTAALAIAMLLNFFVLRAR
ncbi:MAG: hypothetical protein AB7J28_09080 [Hyphomonadaceae bacterium]